MSKYIGISLPLNVVTGKYPNLDVRYRPHNNINEALENVPLQARSLGLTIGIYSFEEGMSNPNSVGGDVTVRVLPQ